MKVLFKVGNCGGFIVGIVILTYHNALFSEYNN